MSILQKINGHDDLTALDDRQRTQLCGEIREFLISNVSKTGGHLAGNLGVVELSVAIETVFNTEIDRLVFDVGHQSYVHKLLTGRQADFPHLRQYGGLSGFPKPSESNTDAFVAGHASSSVSIALGMARARTLLHQDYNVVALIGDGACTGGMAYEGLNDAAVSGEPMVIILNDNEMSIGRNVGGVSRHLSRLRSSGHYLKAKRRYREIMKKTAIGRAAYRVTRRLKNRLKRFLLPASLFENMGFTYLGPVDGHDLPGLISLLTTARDLAEPVVVHVVTKKGCGYRFAEEDPAKFHGIGAFDPEYPKRFFDVGIAEEHAVSMAGGLAKQGMVPVAAIYSTFLQRAYDQIMQDIAMLHLHVILAIDRAGLVGDDGATHHGVFDVGFLRQVPGMLILSPASLAEQKDMLSWAAEKYNGPVAIRYPRGGEGSYRDSAWQPGENVEAEGLLCCHRHGGDVTLVTYGSMLDNVLEAAEILSRRGIEATVLRLLTVSALPTREILTEMSENRHVIVAEEVCTGSGIREALAWELRKLCPDCRVDGVDLGADFVTHGSTKELYRHYGLDGESIANFTQGVLS